MKDINMLTRKHFCGLANALAQGIALEDGNVLKSVKQWLKSENSKFDDAKFDDYILKLVTKYSEDKHEMVS